MKKLINPLSNNTPIIKNSTNSNKNVQIKPKQLINAFNINNNQIMKTPKNEIKTLKKINYNLNPNFVLTNFTDNKEEYYSIKSSVTTPKVTSKDIIKKTFNKSSLFQSKENQINEIKCSGLQNKKHHMKNQINENKNKDEYSIRNEKTNTKKILNENFQNKNDSQNLLNENNIIKRETFIDANFNKKITIKKEVKDISLFIESDNEASTITEIPFRKNNLDNFNFYISKVPSNNNEKCVFNSKLDISHSFIESCSDIELLKHISLNTRTDKHFNISQDLSFLRRDEDFSINHTNIDDDITTCQYEDYPFKSNLINILNNKTKDTKKCINMPSSYKFTKIKNVNTMRRSGNINPKLLLQSIKKDKNFRFI